MPLPEFYQFMRPILSVISDKEPHMIGSLREAMVKHFALTTAEQEELLPSGRKTRFNDRIYWALTYLRQAQLISSIRRGVVQITERGKQYLEKAPTPITPNDLKVFPEYVDFVSRKRSSAVLPKQDAEVLQSDYNPSIPSATPEEVIYDAFVQYREALITELMEQLRQVSPSRFERLIVEVILRLGYGGLEGDGQVIGRSGDGGVDGVISQDKLGLDKIYLQAKRWTDTPVGSKEIQAFVGALVGMGVDKGVFITTSRFTENAMKYRDKNPNIKLSLIDGNELARIMLDNEIGVSTIQRFELKRLDLDYFEE